MNERLNILRNICESVYDYLPNIQITVDTDYLDNAYKVRVKFFYRGELMGFNRIFHIYDITEKDKEALTEELIKLYNIYLLEDKLDEIIKKFIELSKELENE